MARSRSMSRYAYSRPAPRWPWLLAAAAAVAVVAGFVLTSSGRLPAVSVSFDRGLAGFAQVATTPATDPAPPAVAADAAPPEGDDGEQAVGNAASAESEDVADDAAALPAVPAATAAPLPPEDVAARFVDRWNAADYDAMYDLLSSNAQRRVSREEFADRYQGIVDRAELTNVRASIAGELTPGRDVPIRAEFSSALVGDFSQEGAIALVRDAGAWRVDWSPSLIFRDLGADGCVDVAIEPERRGTIFDRDRQPLAYDGTVHRVGVVPGQIPANEEERVLEALRELTGTPVKTLEDRIAEADPNWFVPIKDFPEVRGDELLNLVADLPGASVHSATARVYPLADKAAHITGYVSEATAEQLEADPELEAGQVIGQAGVEAGADDVLTGRPGARLVVVACESRVERSTIAARRAIPARDVVLTIDRDLQMETDAALRDQGDVKGSAVVLDPRTGATLALASIPSYDPNGFVLGFSPIERSQLNSEQRRPLLDRAAEAAYPTGSIFKVITFAAAMEGLDYTPDTVLDCPSTFGLDGANQVWEDWTVAEGMGPQGPLTLHQALVNSCNTIFYGIGRDADDVDPTLLPEMTRGFGLGAPTGIPYFPEVGGTVPDPDWKRETFGDYWATGDAVNLAIGQGFLEATPLQMATAYAAIANGGDLLRPYIVAEIVGPGSERETVGQREVRDRLPVSEATIAALQAALRAQTSDWNGFGSVQVFGDFGWPISGKTGTAQNQLDRAQKPHSWFAAFGPSGEEATIATTVMIENVGEGVSFAAPVTRRIYEAYLGSDLIAAG